MIKHPPISRFVTALAAATMLAGTGASTGAAFPGANGKIAFDSARGGNLDIYAMNPDGSRRDEPHRATRRPIPSPRGRRTGARSRSSPIAAAPARSGS